MIGTKVDDASLLRARRGKTFRDGGAGEVEGKEAEKRVKKRKVREREREGDMIKMRKRKETRGFTWTEEMGYSGARRQVGG